MSGASKQPEHEHFWQHLRSHMKWTLASIALCGIGGVIVFFHTKREPAETEAWGHFEECLKEHLSHLKDPVHLVTHELAVLRQAQALLSSADECGGPRNSLHDPRLKAALPVGHQSALQLLHDQAERDKFKTDLTTHWALISGQALPGQQAHGPMNLNELIEATDKLSKQLDDRQKAGH